MENDSAKSIGTKRPARLPRVCQITGLSPASVWRKVKYDAAFPKPFKISAAVTAWDEEEVSEWIEAKKAARGLS